MVRAVVHRILAKTLEESRRRRRLHGPARKRLAENDGQLACQLVPRRQPARSDGILSLKRGRQKSEIRKTIIGICSITDKLSFSSLEKARTTWYLTGGHPLFLHVTETGIALVISLSCRRDPNPPGVCTTCRSAGCTGFITPCVSFLSGGQEGAPGWG